MNDSTPSSELPDPRGGAAVTFPVTSEQDVVEVRSAGRTFAERAGCSPIERTVLCTVISELARNVLVHGGGGHITFALFRRAEQLGIRIVARDSGPGIPDLQTAMTDGYSTIGALGLGLPGTRRIVDEFSVRSEPNRGTMVTIVKWISQCSQTASP